MEYFIYGSIDYYGDPPNCILSLYSLFAIKIVIKANGTAAIKSIT